jgi:hypothetical protein
VLSKEERLIFTKIKYIYFIFNFLYIIFKINLKIKFVSHFNNQFIIFKNYKMKYNFKIYIITKFTFYQKKKKKKLSHFNIFILIIFIKL